MMMASDPELSAAGRARAEALASMLKDAGVTAIFATEYKRTQQTAAPLAKLLGITLQSVPSKDTAALVGRVKSAKGDVLVVGHSNTVPEIVKALGIDIPITVGEADYDNLFVVTLGPKPALLRLHFR
jgi:2,3-bisphosphoglycerate-dependent phosphoglycerate mutase